MDDRLSIHFVEDKTKSILFASKREIKEVPKLNINYKNTQIKQHSKVTYLCCILDETMPGESIALKIINKINSRLKFLHRKNKFLTPALHRLLCNTLIQPHFDYASSAWYPHLTQKMKNEIQITKNKCIPYCLQLGKMTHISKNEFETLNWLPVKDRFNQSINSTVFKYFTKQCPSYLNEVFELYCPNNLRTRNSYLKLICPFRKTNVDQNTLSFIGPLVPQYGIKPQRFTKKTNRFNTFKHNLKKYYLAQLKSAENKL